MRFVKILLICILLCACSANNDIVLDKIFDNKDASDARTNNYSEYIDYYCPSDIHEVSADTTSVVFELNDSKIILNVNMAGIINSEYHSEDALNDDGFFDKEKLTYSKKSFYYDKNKNEIDYYINLYDYDDQYLMHLANSDVNIYGYCKKEDVELMANKIYDLLKSCSVNTQAVLSNYSSRDVIEYQKSTVNLFETIMPVEGRIDDMMIEDNKEAVSEN